MIKIAHWPHAGTEIKMLQLAGSDKYISVSEWQGVTRIHIRTYFRNNGSSPGGGDLIPTKKGVALRIEEWKALKANVDHIDAMIAFSEDDCILGKSPANELPPAPQSPQSLIPEACQYKPPSAASVGRQYSQIRRATPYLRPYELEPLDQ